MNSEKRFFNPFFIWSIGSYLFLLAVAVTLLLFLRVRYDQVLGDYGWRGAGSFREWISLPLLLGSTILAFLAWKKRRDDTTTPLLISIWSFFVGMEECDWTQQIFHFESPTFFKMHNGAQSFNLHNLNFPTGALIDAAVILCILVYALAALKKLVVAKDPIAGNVVAWALLVPCTEFVLINSEFSGTLLQISLYLFLLAHTAQLYFYRARN